MDNGSLAKESPDLSLMDLQLDLTSKTLAWTLILSPEKQYLWLPAPSPHAPGPTQAETS